MANIKVAVRIRPVSEREVNVTGAEIIVHTDGNELSLTNLKVSASKAGDSRKRTRRYGFDYCFNSSSVDSEAHATQEKVYETLGRTALDALFSGFNACLVAYGQSASGKTYTMMGPKTEPGLTPRLCEGLFLRISEEEKRGGYYEIAISYLEIYNERVRDLLKPSTNSSGGLRVREHPRLGPYVQGLTRQTVSTLGSLMSYIEEGTRARKTASTSQNPTSSRSHALLTVSLTSRSENSSVAGTSGPEKKQQQHVGRGARLHLVDLAGSERAGNSNYGLHRLKEGANINKSLVALGNVISALAERGATGSSPGRRFIPYRDSALTWLLKDALGGNATTIMLATISPASGSYNETAHTLRFAHRAQSVVNRPVVNEDPVARVIRELRAEISRLTSLLSEKQEVGRDSGSPCSCKTGIQKEEEIGPEKCAENEIVNELSSRCSSRSTLHRRSNSEEGLSSLKCRQSEAETPQLRKFGSLRSLDSEETSSVDSPKENVSYEGVNTLALVDIPTLVAVLIKPEVNQVASVQIEEISGETILEDSVEETLDGPVFGDSDKLVAAIDDGVNGPEGPRSLSKDSLSFIPKDNEVVLSDWEGKEKRLVERDDSIDQKESSSLKIISKKFGSSESFDSLKKRENPGGLIQRSYTNLQLVKGNKPSNIAPSSAAKVKRTWSPRGSTSTSSKKVENVVEKDVPRRASKDALVANQSKTSSPSRNKLQDSESPKRKFSKDSTSSSGAKEDSSSTPPSKQVKRSPISGDTSGRTQTPIHRINTRAKIVAAVTERLYSAKKPSEESTSSSQNSEFRSPESTELKLANATRMRLQEISRKMLARRRRACVNTQTDIASTVRVKDTASLTENQQIATKDASVVTDIQENCNETFAENITGSSVVRVKEIATSTEISARTVCCKDAEVLTEDSGIDISNGEDYSYPEIVSVRPPPQRKPCLTESSTNTATRASKSRCFGSQTVTEDVSTRSKCPQSAQERYQLPPSSNSERNVICITLPDMLSITIESPNTLESKIAVTEGAAITATMDEKVTSSMRDGKTQTDIPKESATTAKSADSSGKLNYVLVNDSSTTVTTRSAACQSDGRTFRIENIFKDSKSDTRQTDRNVALELLPDLTEHVVPKTSLKLTNSVGTCFTPETTERSTEIERANFVDSQAVRRADNLSLLKLRSEDLKFIKSSRRGFDVQGRNSFLNDSSPRLPGSDPAKNTHNHSRKSMDSYGTQSFCKRKPVLDKYGSSKPLTVKNVAKIEAEELKSPLLVAKMIANTSLDVESNFSDDSLDPDEGISQPGSKSVPSRLDDTLCPPDVVAHTKKDLYESRVDVDDFANDVVEFPRSSLPSGGKTRVHDYESLVLGRRSFTSIGQDQGDTNGTETPESEEGRSNQFKKKVSFSNSRLPDRRRTNDARRPKPIIKNSPLLRLGNDDTAEDGAAAKTLKPSTSTHLDYSASENSFHDDMSSISGSSETVRSRGLYNSEDESDERTMGRKQEEESEMKRVRFTTFLFGESGGESETSDSEGCDNVVSDEESFCCDMKREVFASYLDEATAFVHNMSTVNEYVNAARFFRRGKDSDEDYIEYKGRKISLRDDTDEYMKEETFDVPLDSYRDCLRGIEKLEECISRACRHDKFLVDQYGTHLESAATNFSLVDPGEDLNSRKISLGEGFAHPVAASRLQNSCIDDFTPELGEDSSDLEASIFQELMKSTTPRQKIASAKPYFHRSTRMSDLSGRGLASYSRLRKRHGAGNLRRDTTSSLEHQKWLEKSNCYPILDSGTPRTSGVAMEDRELKVPQCFLAVPGTGTASLSREYRSDGGTSSSEAICTSSESIDTVASVRSRLRYPGSPRAKLLQLVSERRQIVHRSRNASPN